MKKIVLGLGAVAVLIVGVGPVITGNLAEKEFSKLVETLNQDPQVSVSIESYNKGFLTADAKLGLQLHTGSPELDEKLHSVDVAIEHGPILLSESSIGLSSMKVSVPSSALGFEAFTSNDEFASYKAVLGFDQSLHHSIKMSPIAINDLHKFNFAGLEVNFDSDLAFSHVKGDVLIGAAELTYANPSTGSSTSTISESEVVFDWKEVGHNDLMLGFSEWNTSKLTMNMGILDVNVSNVSVKAEIDVIDGAINAEQSISVQSVSGPMKLDNLLFKFDMSNIKLETYDAFIALTTAMQAIQQGDEINDDAFKALLRPVFQTGMRNTQHLSLEVAGGKVQADLNAEFVGDGNTVDALFVQDDEQLLSSIIANVEASADSAAVMKTPLALMVPGWAQQGLISMNGDKFEFKAAVKDGMLDLNGQIIPLVAFLEAGSQP